MLADFARRDWLASHLEHFRRGINGESRVSLSMCSCVLQAPSPCLVRASERQRPAPRKATRPTALVAERLSPGAQVPDKTDH